MKDNTWMKRILILLGVLMFVCIVIVAVFLLLLAPAFVETTMPNDVYTIRITGLSGLITNGTATIMLPIPANADGVPISSEGTLSGSQVSGWQTSVRETPHGKMFAFTTTDKYLFDIFKPFGGFGMKGGPRLLKPVLQTPENVSIAGFSRLSDGIYTTVIFLDGIVPESGNATPVSFELKYEGGGGMKHLVQGDTWTTTIRSTVPGTASGFVAVEADYIVLEGGLRI